MHHDRPIEEGTWAWVIRLATSVVAIACARLLLNPLGLGTPPLQGMASLEACPNTHIPHTAC
jgi:hypothetical protein